MIKFTAIGNQPLRHTVTNHHRGHGHIARCQAFGKRHHIRLQRIIIAGKPVTGATKAGDHFVNDKQNIMLAADRLYLVQIASRRDDHTASALNRLGNKCRHMIGANLGDFIIQPARRRRRKIIFRQIALMQKSVRRLDMHKAGLSCRLLMHAGHAAHAG